MWLRVLFSQDPEETTRAIVRTAYKLPDHAQVRKTRDALVSSNKKVTEKSITQARVAGDGIGVTAQTRNYNHSTEEQAQEPADKQPNHLGQKPLHTESTALPPAKNTTNQDSRNQAEHTIRTIRDTEIYKKLSARYSCANVAWTSVTVANWKKVSVTPRGSIVVSGLVELDIPLALVVVDVYGVWDPKTRAFDTNNTKFHLRRLQRKQQTPLIR